MGQNIMHIIMCKYQTIIRYENERKKKLPEQLNEILGPQTEATNKLIINVIFKVF